ncbi:hypothetical protein [Aquisalibacillus elongatus]|uniref:Uncharacterized protein n=1 Tax=Aquisalibacillus elongatus TaxID=485577 RepID=A0A3N5CFC1_9BACI|nr:hypothetical protein [Aquisalibacillus elongatus]RPF56011.1 hypothetical protein EDC24_0898 [Aquisalibacillus elongatus]
MKQIGRMVPTTKQNTTQSNVLTLREGQLVTGRVAKFFPGDKAAINLSGHQVVAQLDTSLQSNQNYLMQVKGSNPIQLQVVNEQSVSSYLDAAQRLISMAGAKANQSEQLLLARMLEQQLPIKLNQVSSLIQLAKQNHVPNQSSILTEMVQRQLPLNQDVFNAIHQRVNQPLSFSNVINDVKGLLNQVQTVDSIQLGQRLNMLSQGTVNQNEVLQTFALQTLKEVGQGSQTTFNLFQKAGLISSQTTFQEWSNAWRSWASQHQVQFQSTNQSSSLPPLPFNITADQITNTVQQLSQNQIEPKSNELPLLRTMAQYLNQLASGQSLNQQQQQLLQRGISSGVWQNVQTEGHQQLTQAISNQNWQQAQTLLQSNNGQSLLNQLTALIDQQVTQGEQRALSFWQTMASLNASNESQSFQHIKNLMQLIQVETSVQREYPSMMTLIQSVQSQSNQTGLNEALQQMNQIVQSMHLSQNESSMRDWMSFTLQIPKDDLGLNQDLFMEFEGNQQEDGQLNPYQCRVIFYLDLPQLNETIIDMHVQNQVTSISIYHENPDKLKQVAEPLIPHLKENLSDKGYSAVQVTFKSIYERHQTETKKVQAYTKDWSQGVDFRV